MSTVDTSCGFFTTLWRKLNASKTPVAQGGVVKSDEIKHDDGMCEDKDTTVTEKNEDKGTSEVSPNNSQKQDNELASTLETNCDSEFQEHNNSGGTRHYVSYRPMPAFQMQHYTHGNSTVVHGLTTLVGHQAQSCPYSSDFGSKAGTATKPETGLTIDRSILPRMKESELYAVSKMRWAQSKVPTTKTGTSGRHKGTQQKPKAAGDRGRVQTEFPYFMPEHLYKDIKRKERLKCLRRELRLDLETQLDCEWGEHCHKAYQLPPVVSGKSTSLLAKSPSITTLLKLEAIHPYPHNRVGRLRQTCTGNSLTPGHQQRLPSGASKQSLQRRDVASNIIREYRLSAQLNFDYAPETVEDIEDTIWRGEEGWGEKPSPAPNIWPDVLTGLVTWVPWHGETAAQERHGHHSPATGFSLTQVIQRGDSLRDGMLLQGVCATQNFGPKEERFVSQLMNLERMQLLTRLEEEEQSSAIRGEDAAAQSEEKTCPSKVFRLQQYRCPGDKSHDPGSHSSPSLSETAHRDQAKRRGEKSVSHRTKGLPSFKQTSARGHENRGTWKSTQLYPTRFPSPWDNLLITTNCSNQFRQPETRSEGRRGYLSASQRVCNLPTLPLTMFSHSLSATGQQQQQGNQVRNKLRPARSTLLIPSHLTRPKTAYQCKDKVLGRREGLRV